MSIRTRIISKRIRPEDLEWLVEELKPDAIECIATGLTTVTWTDRGNREEEIHWLFFKNNVTGQRSYDVHSYGYSEEYGKHEKWLGEAEKYVATGMIPLWAEAVDFEMMKK
jgi:hypothetical protein